MFDRLSHRWCAVTPGTGGLQAGTYPHAADVVLGPEYGPRQALNLGIGGRAILSNSRRWRTPGVRTGYPVDPLGQIRNLR